MDSCDGVSESAELGANKGIRLEKSTCPEESL